MDMSSDTTPISEDAATASMVSEPLLPQTSVPSTPSGQDPSPEEIQQLEGSLAAAWTAVRQQEFASALGELDRIDELPMSEGGAEKYHRLRLMIEYARNFDTSLRDAIGSLRGGDEIEVGTSAVVGVVETLPGRITVRVAGANRTYSTESLPAGLAIAIADTRLDSNDPVSLVLKAAYLATQQETRDDRLAKAREWLREAAGKGVDIGDLEKVLDDDFGSADSS
jgi:hypothetical protein